MARKQSRCVSSLSWSKRVNETKIGNSHRMRTSRGAAHPDSNSTMPFKVLHSTDAAEIKIRINDAAAPTDEDEEIERILQLNKIVSLKEYVCSLRRRITSLLATGTNLLTKQWKFCAVAANALPEPHRTDLLNMCHESAIRYVLSCRECVTPLPRCAPYSPLAFFTECIKKTPAKTITMSKWTNGERQESNFAASEATVRHFHERNPFPHDCELWRTIAIEVESAESAEHFSGPVEKKVNIVTGGSGSGKTSWALTSTRVGFYLTPSDFNAEDLARINGYTDCEFFKRNREVVSTLEAALTIVMDGVLDSIMVVPMSEEPVDVSIVLDDFTEHHTFVRGLLSSGSIFFRLERLMHVTVNLNLLVIGSIADCREPGRVLMIMPLFPPMCNALQDALERRYSVRTATLIKAMKSHALAMLLVHNARFAALLAKRLIALCDEVAVADDGRDDLFTVSEALSTLDAQIPLTARDCLALGPMRNFDAATIAAACDVAMALRLRDLLNDKKLSHREVQLTDSLGLTTNRAFIKSEQTFEQRREEERSESRLDEYGFVTIDIIPDPYLYCSHTLVAPPRGRYEMSTAQYLLCRMNYGLKELIDAPSWRRYEVIVAEYVADLIRGLNTRPLRTLMRHINAPYRRISEDASLTKRLCFKTVAIVQRDESISLDCLDAGINPELAHVVVGAPGSPYGEVVVILPHIAVIGIRCTFHGYDIAVNELSEKTLRDGLKTFAQVPGGEKYYCIWATNGVLGFPQGTFGEMRN